jgi:hypothetical protein
MTSSPAFIGFASAVAWFGAFVIVHIVGWRAGHGNARWLVVSYAMSVLATLVTAIGFVAGSQPLLVVVLAVSVALMTSACLFVLYVPAVYVVLTSVSVQTLVTLRRGGGALSEAELYDRFAGRSILKGRLATLTGSGYLAREGTRFRLTSRGRTLAAIFAFIKTLWKLGSGG